MVSREANSCENFHLLTLTKKHFKEEPWRSFNESSGILKISVSDTGCGMTEAEQKRLFQQFSQVNKEVAKRKFGTGLGLYITKQICEKLHGEIRVFSKPGKGSCFITCIPVDAVPVPRLRSSTSLTAIYNEIEKKNLRALVVDGSDFSQTIFKRYLEKLGIKEVISEKDCTNGIIQYDKMREGGQEVDIVILGKQSSLVEGQDAAWLIREYEKENRMKKCVLISVKDDDLISRYDSPCMTPKARIDHTLREPVSFRDLFKIIHDSLGQLHV